MALARLRMSHHRESRLLWMQERLYLATTFSHKARKLKSRARTRLLRHPLKTMNPKRLVLLDSHRTAMFCRSRTRLYWKSLRRAPPPFPSRMVPPHLLLTLHQQRALRWRKRRSRGRWMLNRQRQMRSAKNCSPMRTRDREKNWLVGNVLFISHLSRLEMYTSCYVMRTVPCFYLACRTGLRFTAG
jgi:hypothetical protein